MRGARVRGAPATRETQPDTHGSSRVFFALWPDAAVRAALESLARDCAAQTGGRAPDVANLHLTLAFIGQVSASRVAMLREIGRSTAAAVPSFALTLDRIDAFHKQGIVWAGPASESRAVQELAAKLSALLTPAGFELEDRAFHPHVTLVRRARPRMLDTTRSGVLPVPIVWNVSRMTLAASEHAHGALRYVAVDGWPLGGGATE